MEMTKMIQVLRTEFNKEIEILKRTQDEMKMELKNPTTYLDNSKGSLTGRMNQAEDRISGLENKVDDLDQIRKEYKTLKNI